jgi:hypothetical protein
MDKKDDLFRQFGIASIMARSYDRKSLPRDKYGFEPVKDFFFASDQEDESSDSDSPSPPPVIKSHQSKVNGLDKSKPNTRLTRSMSSMIKSPLNDSSNTTVVRSKSSTPLIASKATAKSSSINNLSCVQPSSTVVRSKSSTGPITRSQYQATNDRLEVGIRAKLFDTPSSMSDSYLTNNKSLPPASPVMKSKSKIDKSKVSQSRSQSKVISTSTSSTVTISQSVTTKRRKKRKRITMPTRNNKVSKNKANSKEQIKENVDEEEEKEEEERSDNNDDTRQGYEITLIPIQRKTLFSPNVRRTRRPHINTLGCGDYIQYVDHLGDTPSKQFGREAICIVQRKKEGKKSKRNVVINEQARKAVETRNNLERNQKQREGMEQHLRDLVRKARDERVGIRTEAGDEEADDQFLPEARHAKHSNDKDVETPRSKKGRY